MIRKIEVYECVCDGCGTVLKSNDKIKHQLCSVCKDNEDNKEILEDFKKQELTDPFPKLVYNTNGLNQLASQLNAYSIKAGFKDTPTETRLLLMISEIIEATEAFNINKFANLSESEKKSISGWVDDNDFKKAFKANIKDSFEDELVDTLARVLGSCDHWNIDIEYHLQQKMRYNSLRGYKHGGKKF